MAAERSDEEHVNSMDQHGPDMGKDKTDERREVGGEGAKGKAANHVQPGRGQPGQQCTRAGTSGGEAAMERGVWSSRRKKRRRQQESTRGKGCVHGSQGRWRERTRRAREGKREEKEKQTRGIRTGTSREAKHPDWNVRGAEARDWSVQGRQRPGIATSGAAKGGDYGSGEQRRGAHEQGQGPDEEGYDERESGSGRGRSRWKSGQTRGTRTGTTREAAHQDWNIQGRGGPGWERPGLQEEDEAAAARNSKENNYKNRGRGRTRTRRARGGKREEKKKNERRMSTWNPDPCS